MQPNLVGMGTFCSFGAHCSSLPHESKKTCLTQQFYFCARVMGLEARMIKKKTLFLNLTTSSCMSESCMNMNNVNLRVFIKR